MTSLLSPLAQPFHPHFSQESFQVFNDGIPSLIPSLRGDLIRLISDEAIDECYPPATAVEAAELDAAEQFCAALARLEALEEYEERRREDLSEYCTKRWHARRTLRHKPKPARRGRDLGEQQNGRELKNKEQQQLMLYDRRSQGTALDVKALEAKHIYEKMAMSKRQSKRGRNRPVAFKPIQQPRKGN